jgi:Nucleoside 2-deoxyribosyltransferase like
MAQIIKPPTPLPDMFAAPSIFLAGSIAMGQAEPWQAEVERALADLPTIILNPRRDEWDASWPQRADHAQFRGQVEWELAAQERAGLIAMYFAPGTQAPITLLELGLFADSGRLVVCCPEGFWRKGNVDIVCERYGVPQVDELDALIEDIHRRLLHG